MQQKQFYLAIFLVLNVSLLLTCGCGSDKLKTERVTGIVTMNGKPVAGAVVTFSPVDRTKSHPATGHTDDKGKYTLQTLLGDVDAGTTPGDYKVMVTKTKDVETGRVQKVTVGDQVEEVKEMKSEQLLPKRYSSISSTPLKKTVIAGSNVIDIELEP